VVIGVGHSGVVVSDVLSLSGICSEVVNMGVALALLKTMQKQNLTAMHPTLYTETMRVRATTTSWAKVCYLRRCWAR
jgi:hypothetical protein